jgi:hypothetical protein
VCFSLIPAKRTVPHPFCGLIAEWMGQQAPNQKVFSNPYSLFPILVFGALPERGLQLKNLQLNLLDFF